MKWRCSLCHVTGTGFDTAHALLRLEAHYLRRHRVPS